MLVKLDCEKDKKLPEYKTKGLAFTIQIEDEKKDIFEFVKASRMIYNIIPSRKYYLIIKKAFDFILALTSIIILIPAFVFIALVIKATSEGPVFFKHRRIGRDLKPFYLYKFRTMIKDAHSKQQDFQNINEMKGGKLFKSQNDPRITKIGKILRKYSIDELPQVFNILKGEMSIIGPRPLSTPIIEYKQYQLLRFIVKPGLGCIWQAFYREKTDFDRWIKTDLIYLKHLGFCFDFRLMLQILKNTIIGKGSR